MPETTQFCTFRVDDLFLGIDVQRVQEVIRSLEITSVPLAPSSVEGLINLRGQIVTAIDLRRRLGLTSRLSEHEPMHVVVRGDDGAVSLMVDSIEDVIEVDPRDFERVPESIEPSVRDLLAGVYKLDTGLLLALQTDRAVAVTTATI
ncbi:chemotaxis protein CheW [Gemmatimonas groenlandica]|uniref:Chemotaxis protein CheW n=1 Tax=Gemmatimonas groenlandica TaxID=2732249 RepID=A0A6M4IMR4_9BACT|nr:chemotaxis protein CheW [Gemmatimonas groenlandica]QJR35960.1 chemotaxis protein CheW [Gemmatimonas groenlandica]